ncbi:SIT4 phosphatase-associated protein-domain-containing protein [Pisolithus marmoratus]|nr:SIT4 phosphatase-associated protein-domain-containing protein [Pisolithus marmoratus]
MFWRFGFHNASAIDSLLDKEDVSLEAILDEDDLLQECKAQNTRLIDFFQRTDVLKRLLGYVTGQIEGHEERGRFKYPYVATEVLCSEIWSIVETCVNNAEELLAPFWETVLDKSPEDMKTEMVMASHFAKVNSVFLTKKPAEMLAFIQSQPNIVERLLHHVEAPSIVDLLVRIVQLDEQPGGSGVLEWFSDVHAVVSELIKGIISMAAPSPGAGLTDGLQNLPASNRFARELARRESIDTLVGYILDLPDVHSATSSVVHSISIIIELIRKNNSDYFEPYLFHTLRNRLIQEMVDRMGVVHLGPLLEVMSERLPDFQRCLRQPRSSQGPVPTTVGLIQAANIRTVSYLASCTQNFCTVRIWPSSNRSSEHSYLYDSQGRLQGGLSSLEQLARVIAIGSGDEAEQENDGPRDEVEPALELPIHNPRSSSVLDSDDDMSDEPGSSDDDAMEEIVMDDMATKDPRRRPVAPQRSPASEGSVSNSPVSRAYSNHSRRSSKRTTRDLVSEMPTGEMMKQVFLHESVLSVLLDLFFEFPWNNFLHSVVYDFIHQVLTGRVDGGLNRELTIALFRDARLMHRIVEGQKKNDAESVKPKGVRLGYMGHLTLLSEDVITALEHYPPELRLTIARCAPQPDWSEYVTGRYNETKKRDTSLLGGGKPNVNAPRPVARWAVDEEDAKSMVNLDELLLQSPSGDQCRFRPAPIEEDEDDHGAGPPQFARYLAQEMHSEFFPSDASDDEDDDDGGWLAHSTFDLGKPPPARRHQTHKCRRPAASTFDSFCGSSSGPLREALTDDPFGAHFDEDDAFGPFSDAAGTPTSEPIQFATSFSPFMRDGELTPTAGSWTFASGSE